MIRTRGEEKLRLIRKVIKMLIPSIGIAVVLPFGYIIMIHIFNSIDIFRDIGFALMASNVIPILWIISWLMISFAIISSVCFYKQGLAYYDEAANKDHTEKDLDEWCYCGLLKDNKFIQHKRLMHKNDPKFFIQ